MWEYQLSLKIHVIVNNTFGTGEYLLNQLNMVQMLLFTVQRNGLEDTFEYNAFTMKARSKIMRNIGPMSNPFGSFLLIQGLKTLLLRIWTYLAFGVKGDANVRGLEPHSLMLYYLQGKSFDICGRRKNSRDTFFFNDTSTINGRRTIICRSK
ncbi:unnamed protein product [Rhizophagus irregularis]|nr:unnamed protein product [Rhizophagus irregularis]